MRGEANAREKRYRGLVEYSIVVLRSNAPFTYCDKEDEDCKTVFMEPVQLGSHFKTKLTESDSLYIISQITCYMLHVTRNM